MLLFRSQGTTEQTLPALNQFGSCGIIQSIQLGLIQFNRSRSPYRRLPSEGEVLPGQSEHDKRFQHPPLNGEFTIHPLNNRPHLLSDPHSALAVNARLSQLNNKSGPMAMRARHQGKPYVRMQLHLRLQSQRIELSAISRNDEVVDAGFVAPVVGLGRVLGVEVTGGAFGEARVDGEGALVEVEGRVADDDHFVEAFGGGAPVDAVGGGAVADVLPVFAVGLVGDEGAAVGAAEAVVDDCVGALFDDGVAGFL